MQCNFIPKDNDCICIRCNRLVKNHSGQNLIAECRVPCSNLGDCTHQSISIICKSCNGELTSRSYKIHSCKEFGLCIPNFLCTSESKEAIQEWQEINGVSAEIQPCLGCEKFCTD